MKVLQENISIVYQSCNEIFQKGDFSEFPADSILKKLAPYYLYVGSIIERKGLLQTVIAYSELPSQYRKPFIVVGLGDKPYIKKVKDLIRYYQLEDRFHFINSIQNHELLALYDHCFTLIYPSVYEGFGIPVIECLFRNKPVITSDLSSMPEAAGSGICQAMIGLHDENLYNHLVSEGWKHVVSHFSSENTAENMMKLYIEKVEQKDQPL